jgi:hypothetical protein
MIHPHRFKIAGKRARCSVSFMGKEMLLVRPRRLLKKAFGAKHATLAV